MKTQLLQHLPGARDISALLSGVSRRTRMVGLTKIILGLLSLGLILVVILLPQRQVDTDAGVRIAFSDVQQTDKEAPQMIKPSYQGVDEKNQPYNITADVAAQLDNNQVQLTKIAADILLKDKQWLSLSSDSGILEIGNKKLMLTGNVVLFRDDGLEMHGDKIYLDLRAGTATSEIPVSGQGPMGKIHAQGFSVAKETGTLHFNGPVTVTLYPHAQGGQ